MEKKSPRVRRMAAPPLRRRILDQPVRGMAPSDRQQHAAPELDTHSRRHQDTLERGPDDAAPLTRHRHLQPGSHMMSGRLARML